jgi:hypothetical protein
MIERLSPPPPRVSLFEAVLARWLVGLSGRQYFVDVFPPHEFPERPPIPGPDTGPAAGRMSASGEGAAPGVASPADGEEPAPGEDPEAGDEQVPGLAGFRGLLEAGAGHLAAARAAQVEQRRQAAVQARELAAFAAQRPAAVLDRPDEEVGSAAAEALTILGSLRRRLTHPADPGDDPAPF